MIWVGSKGHEARFNPSILLTDRPSILCGPTLNSRSFCAVLASRDDNQ
mgnify:CR=1 FL=1